MSDVIAAQRAALDRLYRAHLSPGTPYALVDFPDHPNVGDSAIWLGELAMLRAVTGRDPDYVSSWHDFDATAFRRACPAGPLLLHGGGNLGDIWPHHQHFREAILTTIRDRPVIQLPQSIHFRDPRAADRFAEIAAAHPDLTLYVRDAPSLAFARRILGDRAMLAPDSAFALGPQPRARPSTARLCLLRTDAERRVQDGAMPMAGPATDWLEDAEGLPPGTGIAAREAQARHRLARGLRLLSQGETIVTDRLHGHILALLLGIPHTVFDNVYGKVGAYIAAWTAAAPSVTLATPGDDAAAGR